MKLHCIRWGGVAAVAGSLLVLGACERRDATQAASPPSPPTAGSASAANSSVQPQGMELPPSKTAGPADGSAAIGGVTTNQPGGDAGSGKAPAPTGGDGAASAASAPGARAPI